MTLYATLATLLHISSTMARPESLEPAQLLKALTATAVGPSILAQKLGVSRATVHRKLEKLLEQHLVVRVGEGPQAAYRLPTPQEQLARSRAQVANAAQTRLVMSTATASAVQQALEMFSRVGIGQIDEIVSQARFSGIRHADGTALSHEELDKAEQLGIALKFHLLGWPSNASFGIYSPHVHPSVLTAWALQRAIRHRMAWDRQPQGSMGVHHDEPLDKDNLAGLFVHSDRLDANGVPTRYIVEMPQDCGQVLGDALRFYLRVSTGDVGAVVDLARTQVLRSKDGEPVTEDAMAKGQALAGALSAVLSGVDEGAYNAQLGKTQVAALTLVKALESYASSGVETKGGSDEAEVVVAPVADSPWAVDIGDLPAGYMLNFNKGRYRVIAPTGEPQQLTIVAESVSLQTALQMAANVAEGRASRSFSM